MAMPGEDKSGNEVMRQKVIILGCVVVVYDSDQAKPGLCRHGLRGVAD